jgi:mono/diheme cytochrome c family protein
MKHLIWGILIVIVLAMIPPAVIARQRAVTSEKRRIHFIQDMDNQPKFRAQHRNDHFADLRAMRPTIEGTVARESFTDDDPMELGYVSVFDRDAGRETSRWLTRFPTGVTVDRSFIERGRGRFEIYCQPCHGLAGYGDGIVHERASRLVEAAVNGTSWVAPKSIHETALREQPVGQIFNTITNGVRNMAGYASQIPTEDRWAIVAYVKALQRSQHALESDLAPGERADLETIRIEGAAIEAEEDAP